MGEMYNTRESRDKIVTKFAIDYDQEFSNFLKTFRKAKFITISCIVLPMATWSIDMAKKIMNERVISIN